MKPVALIVGGGGVSGEIVAPVLEVLEAAGARYDWQRFDVPAISKGDAAATLRDSVDATKELGVALKTKLLVSEGSTATAIQGQSANPNVLLRQMLGLYAGVRPIRTMPGIASRHEDLDLLLIREITEGIYIGIEHEIVDGVVQSIKVVTEAACERIARYAFRIATEHQRKKVTVMHKANIMKRSDGTFLRTTQRVAEEFPDVELEPMIVDAACMNLVLAPERFDVILTDNLYGDILSNLGTGLAGGISTAQSIAVGDGVHVFEATHGDAPHLIGTGNANPLPLLSPALALLRHFDEDEIEGRLRKATTQVLQTQRQSTTPDLGGEASTWQMCRAIIDALD